MKFDHLRSLPPKNRPKSIALWTNTSVFPYLLSSEYFAEWKHLRWFLLFSVPGIASSVWKGLIEYRWGLAIFALVVTQYLITLLFVSFRSGMVSSNWGTYFRKSEPGAFWTNIIITFGVYVFVIVGIWAVK